MAKRPNPELASIYEAAALWVDRALRSNGSLFAPGRAAWAPGTLEDFHRRFAGNPDVSSDTFLRKFGRQLRGASVETVLCAAESLYVYFLLASSVSGKKKREVINSVLGWAPEPLAIPTELDRALDQGLCNPGLSFNTHRPSLLIQLLDFVRRWKSAPARVREDALGDPWSFKQFVMDHPIAKGQAMQHILFHIVHPDSFEPIVSQDHKRQIAEGLAAYVTEPTDDVDQKILQIRRAVDREVGGYAYFYGSPLVERWKPEKPKKGAGKRKRADAETEGPRAWIFQANPRRYRIRDALQELKEIVWSTNQHRGDMNVGDRVYFWESGREPAVLGYGTILVPPTEGLAPTPADREFQTNQWEERESAWRAQVRIDSVQEDPLTKEQLLATDGLRDLSILHRFQGTNFPVSAEEAAVLDGLLGAPETSVPRALKRRVWLIGTGEGGRHWQAFQDRRAALIGWNDLGDLSRFETEEDLRAAMLEEYEPENEPRNNVRACWDFANVVTPGDVIIAKHGQRSLVGFGVVTSDYRFEEGEGGSHVRDVQWKSVGAWTLMGKELLATKTLTEVGRYPEFVDRLFEAAGLDRGAFEGQEPVVPFSLDDLLDDVFIDRDDFMGMLERWRRRRNLLLQGPPGVGKTFVAKRLAYALLRAEDKSRVKIVQFHQSYSYEDFILGYRPDGEGFRLREGPFYEFCRHAQADPDRDYVFIIDEVNRGNLSKIFGELMMLIEGDKRGPEWAIQLTYSASDQDRFYVPENLYLLGLMNTADRSLAMVDYALRRRFSFVDLEPRFGSDRFRSFLEERDVDSDLVSRIVERLSRLNSRISEDTTNLGPGFRVGHSFFCPEEGDLQPDETWYRGVIEHEIAPLLREYWFESPQRADTEVEELLRGLR